MDTSTSLATGLIVLALGGAGCSHEAQEPATPAAASAAVNEPVASSDREVLAVDTAVEPPPPPVAARPRLSRTITLGETQVEPLPDGPAPGPSSGGTTVVVNNYVMTPPAYVAVPYYGGYGYGGYGYGGYGAGYAPRANVVSRAPSTGRWGATGWEGAGRTAAPGHTPAVGGNWAPPPSAGPRQLR